MNVNAVPWANVWVDGRSLGETPLANVQVTPGTHEIVFRHPELGERRIRATVESGVPARIVADLRR
jgi:serine/threonine-protein kinase